MNFAGFWKQLKKRLRRKRRFLSLGIILFVVCCLGVTAWLTRNTLSPTNPKEQAVMALMNPDSTTREDIIALIKDKPVARIAILHNVYLCGEEWQTLGNLSAIALLQFFEDHPDWQVEQISNDKIVLLQQINDLSDTCKQSAYFGMDKDGNLSLYEGLPALKQTIRTFFQLDIKMLESSLPTDTMRQLEKGIRIQDVDEYNSVLSTFSYYAVDDTQEVLRQSP